LGTAGELVCEGLTKIYRRSGERKALDSVDMRLPLRGIFALIGRNGAGKTTLVRILATQLEPSSGTASIDGLDVMGDAPRLRERIAIVPQEARAIPWLTAGQTVSSYLMWRGVSYGDAKRRAREALAKVGLERYENSLNRLLSGGAKRKVLVATILASEAEIIFLDEPTTGLDPISRRELWRILTDLARDRFVLLTTHYLEEAERLAGRIGILNEGKLVGLGTLEELRRMTAFQYSIKLSSENEPPSVKEGIVNRGTDGQIQILTTEEEAHRLSRELLERDYRFSMSRVSLDDVFFHLVKKGSEEGWEETVAP
jgi:ABC-2 type transport system ATP-binding protein